MAASAADFTEPPAGKNMPILRLENQLGSVLATLWAASVFNLTEHIVQPEQVQPE
jgi:hypothetical protein